MKTIYCNYQNTGIKTLRGVAWFILITGMIAALITLTISVIALSHYNSGFIWPILSNVLLILAATLFGFGVCLTLAYLGESAFIARKQREALLVEKGIELEFIDSEHGQKL
jgi:hypothetical protein